MEMFVGLELVTGSYGQACFFFLFSIYHSLPGIADTTARLTRKIVQRQQWLGSRRGQVIQADGIKDGEERMRESTMILGD